MICFASEARKESDGNGYKEARISTHRCKKTVLDMLK